MALPDLTNLFVADSYKGVLHTANVPLSGANLPPVYDGLGNKSSLRLGSDGNGALFNGTVSGNMLTVVGYNTIIDYLYPVGAVYLDTLDVNPQTRFVGTTWGKISEGKFLAGVGSGADKNLTNQILLAGDDASIGEYNHILTISEMPTHNHQISDLLYTPNKSERDNNAGWVDGGVTTTTSTGGDQPHNNIPPYFGVYIWKRLT